MIARWLRKLAEDSEVQLTELVPPGADAPLIFGSNGTLFKAIVGTEAYDDHGNYLSLKVMFRGGFSDPTSVFYADPYYD